MGKDSMDRIFLLLGKSSLFQTNKTQNKLKNKENGKSIYMLFNSCGENSHVNPHEKPQVTVSSTNKIVININSIPIGTFKSCCRG